MTAYGEAAEQIVDMATKSTLKGVEVVTNLAGKGALSLATYLIAVLKEQKRTKGKARIEAFQDKPTKVFAIRREDFEQFAKEAKKYGVLYAAIFNKKEQDGIVDVVVNAKDAARVNRISENFAITAKEIEELRKTILKSKAEKQVERTDPTAEKAAHTVDDVTLSEMMGEPNILNDYDGVRHDFTHKKGLVWQNVFLPEFAPQEWQDRAVLWNAVEEAGKTKDSRLAREFVPALPVELSKEQWQELLSEFIQEQFVADGMCADVAIHDPYPPGHNPHAHILLTVRPLDEHGHWQYKTEKEYLCIKDGEERGLTAAEFRTAQKEGWEKQYLYLVGKKKVYMTPSAAEAQGYERVNKKSNSYLRKDVWEMCPMGYSRH